MVIRRIGKRNTAFRRAVSIEKRVGIALCRGGSRKKSYSFIFSYVYLYASYSVGGSPSL